MVRRDDGTKTESWLDYVNKGKAPTKFEDDRAGGKHHKVPAPGDAILKSDRPK
jgi:dihydropyrimidine dehydrogenase (NAD+) subunit PreA